VTSRRPERRRSSRSQPEEVLPDPEGRASREVDRVHASTTSRSTSPRARRSASSASPAAASPRSAAASCGCSSLQTATSSSTAARSGSSGPRAAAAAPRDADDLPGPVREPEPAKRVGTIISDPMRIHGIGDRKERKEKVEELLRRSASRPSTTTASRTSSQAASASASASPARSRCGRS
jgi:hypothetical protein